MKAYADLGLNKAGIKYIGTGDITTDEELQNMGDAALGVMTVHHYSAAANRPANKAFVAAYKKEYGANLNPGFMAEGAWDAMDVIFHAIREQKGKIDPDKTMEIFRTTRTRTARAARSRSIRKPATSCRTSTCAKSARSAASSPTSSSKPSTRSTRIPGRNSTSRSNREQGPRATRVPRGLLFVRNRNRGTCRTFYRRW